MLNQVIKMRLKNRRLVLYFTIFCIWTQANDSHKLHKVKKKVGHEKAVRKNIPRSALIGIKPEELTENPTSFQDADKGYMKIIDLPSLEESQRITAFSTKMSKLPPGEKGVISDFLKDMERSHGELTPSVMKKMVQLEAYNPVMDPRQSQRVHLTRGREKDSRGSLRSFNFNIEPTNAMNPSILPFKLTGSSATYSNTESNVGEESPNYLSNPLPEYDYKEVKYNLPSSIGNDFNEGYHNNDDGEYSKILDQDYRAEDKTEDIGGDNDKPQNTIATLVGTKGDNLINEIGRRVLLNILEKQKQKNDYEKLNGKGIPDFLGSAAMDTKYLAAGQITGGYSTPLSSTEDTSFVSSHENDVNQDTLQNRNSEYQKVVSLKQTAQAVIPGSSTVAKAIADLGAKALGNTKLITQETQTPIEKELNAKVDAPTSAALPVGSNVDVSGKVNNGIDNKSVKPTTKVTTTAATTATATTPTKMMSTIGKMLESVGRTISTDQTASSNDDVVMLKISGQGKPVSFKADTSVDGSIVLKIPKKYSEKIIQGNEKMTIAKSNDANLQTEDSNQKTPTNDSTSTRLGNLREDAKPLQLGSFVISGKKNPSKDIQSIHPTRNVLPQEDKEIGTGDSKTSDELLQSLNNWKQNVNSALESREESLKQASTGLSVPQDSTDTSHNIAESVFPNVAGGTVNTPNMEQLMTLLAHMEQLPATQLGATAFDGIIPTNYGLRQTVGRKNHGASLLKTVLKTSKVMEDSAVTRNKGIEKESKKGSGNEWSPCTVTCGRGIQARARPCSGHDCSGFTTESRPCNAGPCPEQLAKVGLKMHNKFRRWHGVSPLQWSPSLATKAQKLAQDLALNNDSAMESVEMNELPGENTAIIRNDYTTAAETAVKKWYEEVESYSFAHPSLAGSTKHFTQVVWKGTKKVGIGLAKSSSSNKTYVIALYDPPGNMEGKEAENIQTPHMART